MSACRSRGFHPAIVTWFAGVTCTYCWEPWRRRETHSSPPGDGSEGQMFQILETEQQVFLMACIRIHTYLLHHSQELSLKQARCAVNAQFWKKKHEQLHILPVVLCWLHVLLTSLSLWENCLVLGLLFCSRWWWARQLQSSTGPSTTSWQGLWANHCWAVGTPPKTVTQHKKS